MLRFSPRLRLIGHGKARASVKYGFRRHGDRVGLSATASSFLARPSRRDPCRNDSRRRTHTHKHTYIHIGAMPLISPRVCALACPPFFFSCVLREVGMLLSRQPLFFFSLLLVGALFSASLVRLDSWLAQRDPFFFFGKPPSRRAFLDHQASAGQEHKTRAFGTRRESARRQKQIARGWNSPFFALFFLRLRTHRSISPPFFSFVLLFFCVSRPRTLKTTNKNGEKGRDVENYFCEEK